MEAWLRTKGADDVGVGKREIVYPDGRVAELTREHLETDQGSLSSFILTEPVEGGQFETHLSLASGSDGLTLFCQLGTVSQGVALAPTPFTANCPRVVREIVGAGCWSSGASVAPVNHTTMVGRPSGQQLIDEIWDQDRGLPIVVVSEFNGATLLPNISEQLARDLVGLAKVVQVDEDVSWVISESQGREWSCYMGALRLYWPFQATKYDPFSPYSHPLWTKTYLCRDSGEPFADTTRVRNRLHRIIFGQSAFQATPPLITRIRDRHVSIQRQQALEADDYFKLAESYEQENQNLKKALEDIDDHIKELHDQVEDLNSQIRELSLSLQWTDGASSDLHEEDPGTSPSTVEDAVARAKDECKNLVFGKDVESGISSLAIDAGPPMKILRYLRVLEALTVQLREGSLGIPVHQWLNDRGLVSSGESETVRDSATQMAKRTWDDGSGNVEEFHYHL